MAITHYLIAIEHKALPINPYISRTGLQGAQSISEKKKVQCAPDGLQNAVHVFAINAYNGISEMDPQAQICSVIHI